MGVQMEMERDDGRLDHPRLLVEGQGQTDAAAGAGALLTDGITTNVDVEPPAAAAVVAVAVCC